MFHQLVDAPTLTKLPPILEQKERINNTMTSTPTKSTTATTNKGDATTTPTKTTSSKEEVINYLESSSLRQFLQRALHASFTQKHEQPLEYLYDTLYKELKKNVLDEKKEEEQKAVISELEINFSNKLEEVNEEKRVLKRELDELKNKMNTEKQRMEEKLQEREAMIEHLQQQMLASTSATDTAASTLETVPLSPLSPTATTITSESVSLNESSDHDQQQQLEEAAEQTPVSSDQEEQVSQQQEDDNDESSTPQE